MNKGLKITLWIVGGLMVIGIFAPKEEQTTTATPDTKPAVVVEKTTPPAASDDELFITLARGSYSKELIAVPDQTLIDTARSTCNALRSGMTMNDILVMAAESSIENDLSGSYVEAMGGVIGFGVGIYCPEFAD